MPTTVLDRGLGVAEVLGPPADGRVVAVYRVAAYLRFPAGLVALTSGLAPRGPLHLRVAVLLRLRVGEPVAVDAGVLHGRGWTVPLDCPVWTGALPAVPDAGLDLAALAARVGGRGPGLTPEGDDVLAGALLAARAARGPGAEPELRGVAASVSTTEVAAAFLAWAARGQCIEPAHDWLVAPDEPSRLRVEQRLRAIGASSGAALLDGLRRATGTRGPDGPGGGGGGRRSPAG